MKAEHPRITLLGSNHGRNVGDAAILASILESISSEIPEAEFYVPTTKPSFVRDNYGDQYKVHAVDVMPWTASLRLLGIPTMWCLAKSDLALICDGINFLITLVFLVPWAKLCGCKLVCYSCGIGPFPGYWSKVCARYVINACDLIIFRERDSEAQARELGVTKDIMISGDAAFLNAVSDQKRTSEIAAAEGIDLEKPLIGINVTKYVDSWLSPSERMQGKEGFLGVLSNGISAAREVLGEETQAVVFSTHPMDEEFCSRLASLINGKAILSSKYLSHDLQGLMQHCQLFLGMRFHSLVLASAVRCPILGLVYAPKVRGFMRLLGCEQFSLELAELDQEKLAAAIDEAWPQRDALREKQQVIVDSLRAGARDAAALLGKRYFNLESAESGQVPKSAAG